MSAVASDSIRPVGGIASWIVPYPLKNGKTYFWRCRAFNQGEFNPWSQTYSFYVDAGIHAFPNPSREGDQITFRNVPLGSEIIITTISGDLVKKFENVRETDVIWDLRNNSGRPVASGVYLYIVRSNDQEVQDKIAIIK